MKICSIKDCERPAKARRLCSRHYEALRAENIKAARSGALVAKNDHLIQDLLADPLYDVRSDGTIWAQESFGQASTPHWRQCGHKRIRNRSKGSYCYLRYRGIELAIHRIIWAKYGNSPLVPDLVINHKNGDGTDNKPSNLELISQSKNNAHRFQTLGMRPVVGHKKISFQIAEQIRADEESGLTNRELRAKYGLAKATISYIVNRKTWRTNNIPNS